jgi:hypothetical protein
VASDYYELAFALNEDDVRLDEWLVAATPVIQEANIET